MKKGFTGGLFLVLTYMMVLAHTFFPHVHRNNPFEDACVVEVSCHEDADVVHRFLEIMISVDTGNEHLEHFLACSHAQQRETFNEVVIKAFVNVFTGFADKEDESSVAGYAITRSESLPGNPFLSTSHALRAPPSLA